MGNFKVLLVSALILVSCNTTKHFVGHSFIYESKNRKLELIFEKNGTATLKNTFYCTDIPPDIQEISIACKYRKGTRKYRGSIDTIFLTNNDCQNDAHCKIGLTIFIPPQESKECPFLSAESRTRKFAYGPSYGPASPTEYEKYGRVPNIDIDTLYIYKNKKIILFKRDEQDNIGFIFK